MRDAIATKGSRRLMLVAVGLLAAVAVLPLLVPPSALSWPRRGVSMATEISSATVCGASECRELSDPEAASALAVGPIPGVRTPLRAGCPGTRARTRSAPRSAARCSPAAPPSSWCPPPGCCAWEPTFWVTLPRESKAAYAKLTAGLTPRPARTLPGVGEDAELPVARVDEVVEAPERGHPGAGERRLERVDRRAGRRRASGAHGGVAAQEPPPPRVDAVSGVRDTG